MPPGLQIGKLPDRKKSREFFGISTNILQCAFIGRVEQVKRPDRFLDVVSEMKIRGIEIEFFVAGDGELLEICRERIVREELPVRILGWQSDIEMVLAAADIVILTSDNEGTPLSLIQASMAALPVIATSVGSVPEVVIDGITGILTNFEILRIANALEELAEKPEVRRRLGVAGREYTLANFGVKRLVNDHEKLYKRLITQ